MSISLVLVSFLYQLGTGMAATIAFIPPALVDRRFFKTIGFYAALFTLLGIWIRQNSSFQLSELFTPLASHHALSQGTTVLLALFALVSLVQWGMIRWTERPVKRPLLIGIALLGLAAITLESFLYRPASGPLWVHQILMPLNSFSSAMILGGFLSGMIFGHWYLVNIDMPKKLLVAMAWILIAVLCLRVVAMGTTLALYKWFVYPDANFLTALTSFQGHGIFFWERILVGLAIPAGVVAMIWNTARIGSNQSATGIMYVGIAFVFIGELAARYLFLITGIPL